jgi:cyclic pyranopterin phosphate synthase
MAKRKTGLTHLDAANRPTMVDVAGKQATLREASAEAWVKLPAAVARELKRTGHRTRKGPVFDTAIVAGVMAAKKTHEIIPFCHPLPLERCNVDIGDAPGGRIRIVCTVAVHHKTGVEMEALMGATAAALTLYDMCKAMSHDIEISRVRLLRKSGGKRDFQRQGAPRQPALSAAARTVARKRR